MITRYDATLEISDTGAFVRYNDYLAVVQKLQKISDKWMIDFGLECAKNEKSSKEVKTESGAVYCAHCGHRKH